jgi:predicted negative regulator of RcsB-dependent stress response
LEKQKNLRGARAAYQRAIASHHRKYAPQAAILLGLLLASQGNVDDARAAYQLAINSGRPIDVSFAAMGLGQLLDDHGDIEGARRAYQLAIDSGDEDVSATAERRLNALGHAGPSS